MTPKERREKLFKDKKPHIRKMEQDDFKWLYGAYRYPEPPGDDFEEYRDSAIAQLSAYNEAFIVEDRNQQFKGEYGPVGVVPSLYNGWKIEPHAQWFPWATKMNKVRGTISFIMFLRYSGDIGVAEIRSLEDTAQFFKDLKKYAPIYFVNKIPCGDPRGDSYLFYVRGKKQCHL